MIVDNKPFFFSWEYDVREMRRTKVARYRKSSIKPSGGLIYFKPIWGGRGGLFNLETTRIRKKLKYKVEKLNYERVGGHAAEDQVGK